MLHLVDHGLRVLFFQYFCQSQVPVEADVAVPIERVDAAAVAQDDLVLPVEDR
jgi:hypothetical protein